MNGPQLADISYWDRIISKKKHNEMMLIACTDYFFKNKINEIFLLLMHKSQTVLEKTMSYFPEFL